MPRLVEAWRQRANAVPRKLVSYLMRATFRALAELHGLEDRDGGLGFVHGDLCPDHLLLSDDDEVFFIDFGMASCRSDESRSLGSASSERGTLPYVAPELASGRQVPDAATDVFALAATIAYVALGRPPCHHDSPAAQLVEVVEQGLDLTALVRCSQLDRTERDTLIAALAHDRAQRLVRAVDVLDRLAG